MQALGLLFLNEGLITIHPKPYSIYLRRTIILKLSCQQDKSRCKSLVHLCRVWNQHLLMGYLRITWVQIWQLQPHEPHALAITVITMIIITDIVIIITQITIIASYCFYCCICRSSSSFLLFIAASLRALEAETKRQLQPSTKKVFYKYGWLSTLWPFFGSLLECGTSYLGYPKRDHNFDNYLSTQVRLQKT